MAGLTQEQESLGEQLTKLQRMTIINMVSGMSQRQAYRAAGGTASDKSADVTVSRMLTDAKVKAFYDSLVAKAESEAVMSRQEALERLSKMARVSITDIAEFKQYQAGEDDNGDPVMGTTWHIKNSEDIPCEAAASIKSVTATKIGPKLEMHDPAQAIKQLAELQGWNAASKVEKTHKFEDMANEELDARIKALENEIHSGS